MSRIRSDKLKWHQWSPGIDNGDLTLGAVLDTLPGVPQDAIPLAIRLLENPRSVLAFPGAVTLARHDPIHAVVGRGLTAQDEAFVIGFTMGQDPAAFRFGKRAAGLMKNFFLLLTTLLYPRVYRFDRTERHVFRRGFWEGRKAYSRARRTLGREVAPVHLTPLETMRDMTLAELRRRLGVSVERLRVCYRIERLEFPDRHSAQRLDVCAVTDMADLTTPEGPDSDWRKPEAGT